MRRVVISRLVSALMVMGIIGSPWQTNVFGGILTSTYLGGANNWNNAGSWSLGSVPNGPLFVVFSSSGTNTLDISPSVFSLNMGNANAAIIASSPQTITITSGLTWSAGRLGDNVTLKIPSGSILGSVNLQSAILDLSGTLNHSVGNITVDSGRTPDFNILSGGIYDMSFSGQINGATGGRIDVLSGGIFRKSAGTGTAIILTPINNDGLLQVQAGTLQLRNGGSTSATNEVGSGAMLDYDTGNFIMSGGARTTGTGTWIIGAPIIVTNGTVTADIGFTFGGGGQIGGNGSFIAKQPFLFTGGSLAGSTEIALEQGGTISAATAVADNTINVQAGTLTANGGFSATGTGNDATITISSNAVYDVPANSVTFLVGDSADRLNILQGATLRRSTGTSTATLDWNLNLSGAVDVQTGKLSLNEGGTLDGTMAVANGAELEMTAGTFSLPNGRSVSGAGTLTLRSAETVATNATFTANIDTVLTANTLGGDGTFQANSNFTFNGGLLADALTLNLARGGTVSSGVSVDDNVINVQSGTLMHATTSGISATGTGDDATINVASGAVYDVQAGAVTFVSGDSGDRLNVPLGATLRRSVGTGTATLDWNLNLGGALDVQSGELSLSEGATLDGSVSVANGATMTLSSGSYPLPNGRSADGAGTLDLRATETVATNTTFTVNIDTVLTANTLGGDGTFQANSNFTFSGGSLANALALNLARGGTVASGVSLDDNTINVQSGTLSHTTTSGISATGTGDDATINVASGAIYDVQMNSGTFVSGDTADRLNVPLGATLRRSSGTGTATLDWNLNLGGLLDVQTGVLSLDEGATLDGAMSVASGASLDLTAGTYPLPNTRSVGGAGTLRLRATETVATNATFTANIDTALTANTLGGDGVFQANSNFTFNGGSLADALTLNLARGGTVASGVTLDDNIINVQSGTLAHPTSSSISATGTGDDATINVASNAMYMVNMSAGTFLSGDSADRLNVPLGATLRRSSGAGNALLDWYLNLGGSLDVQSGKLSLNEGANLDGTMTVAAGAELELFGGSYPLPNGRSVDGAGTLTMRAGQSVATNETFSANIDTVFTANTLGGDGTFQANSNFTFSGGLLVNALTLNLARGGTVAAGVSLEDNVINVQSGTLAHTVASSISATGTGDDATINVASNAVYEFSAASGTFLSGDAADRLNVPLGATLRRTTGTGTATLDWNLNLGGALDVQTGKLSLTEGATLDGTMSVASGAELELNAGAHTLSDGRSVTGAGIFNLRGTETVATNTTFTSNIDTILNGNTLGGDGTFQANSNFTFNGGEAADSLIINLARGGTVSSGARLRDTTINIQGGTLAHTTASSIIATGTGDDATINVASNAVYDAQANSGTFLSGDSADRLNIAAGGTFRRSIGTSTATILWSVVNSGTVTVDSGTLSFPGSGTFTQVAGNTVLNGGNIFASSPFQLQGGMLTGTGMVTAAVFNSGGTVSPGASPGIMVISGNYTQSAGGLNIELGGTAVGTGHDQLQVTGTASLGGALNVSLINGFLPATGNGFTILTAPIVSGTFTNTPGNKVTLTDGSTLDVIYTSTNVQLTNFVLGATIVTNVGGSTAWNTAGSWLPSIVPNNAGPTNFFTRIVNAGVVTLNIDPVISGLLLQNGAATLGGNSRTLTVNGPFNWNGGLLGIGLTLASQSGNVSGNGSMQQMTWQIDGSHAHTAGVISSFSVHNPTLLIRTNGIYDIQFDGTPFSGDASDRVTINPGGILRRSTGTGVAAVQWGINNSGAIEVQSGELSFVSGGTIGGSSTVLTNAVLHLDSGTFLLVDGGQIGGAGPMRVTSALQPPSGGTFSVNGPVELIAGGILQGSGTLALLGGGTIGNSFQFAQGPIADIRSRVLHTNGSVSSPSAHNPTLRVSSGGILEYPDDSGSFTGDTSDTIDVVSGGILRKSAGTGTNTIGWSVDNQGTVQAQSGTLRLNAGGALGGVLTAETGAAVELDGGTFSLADGGQVIGAGTLRIAAVANVPASATFTNIGTVELHPGGAIGGNGVYAANGQFNIEGGAFNQPVTVNINSNAAVHAGASFGQMTMNVSGNVTHAAGGHSSQSAHNPVLRILTNGVYDINSSGTPFGGDAGDTIVIDAGGALRKSADSGTAVIQWRVNNSGAFDVRAGELSLVAGGTIGGASTVLPNAILHLDTGTYTLANGGQINGAGLFRLTTSLVVAAGSFSANAPVDFTAGGIFGSAGAGGTLALLGGGAMGNGFAINESQLIDIRSRVFHTNGAVASSSAHNPTLRISAGGILDYPDESGFFSGDTGDSIDIVTGGILRKSAGTGTNTIGWSVDNQGTVDVQSGMLRLNAGGELGGQLVATNSATLHLDGGTFTLVNGGQFTGAGNLLISTTANAATGGTFTNLGIVDLVTGGAIGGSGTYAANGQFNIHGGNFNQPVTFHVNSNATVFGGAAFGQMQMNVFGTVTHSNGQHSSQSGHNPTVQIETNGVYDIRFDGTIFAGGSSDNLVINAGGTLRKSASSGTSVIQWLLTNPSGMIDVQSGELNIVSGGTLGGSATIAAGARLHLDSGAYILGNAGQVGGAGAFRVSSGINGPSGGSYTVNAPVEWVSGGSLSGGGVVTVNGSGTIGDGFAFNQGPILELRSQVAFTNGAARSGSGHNPTMRVGNGGVMDFPDDTGGLLGGSSDTLQLLAGGTIRKSGGNGTNSVNWALSSAGTIDARRGMMFFGGDLTQTGGEILLAGGRIDALTTIQLQGGSVTGSGAIETAVNNTGANISPGNSRGTITINGAYSQSASGTLSVELEDGDGILSDRLTVNGVATLGGNLNVSLLNNPSISSNDVVTIITGTSVSGTFANAPGNKVVITNVGTFDVEYLSNSVRLRNFNPSTTVSSSSAPNFAGAIGMGGSGFDDATGSATDTSGNVYVAGTFAGTGTFGTNVMTATGSDMFLLKFDLSGNLVWARKAGGSADDHGHAVATDPSGNVYVTGHFSSTDAIFGANQIASVGQDDVFTAKYDGNGNALWVRRAGGSGFDVGNAIFADAGGVYVTGGHTTPGAEFGGTNLVAVGGLDAFTVRYDANGNVLWARNGGGTGFDEGKGIGADGTGVYVTGFFFSTQAAFDGTSLTNQGGGDAYVVKYDSAGNLLWAKRAGGSGQDTGLDLGVGNGLVGVVGQFYSTDFTFGGDTLTNRGSGDGFLLGFDPNGNALGAIEFGGSGNDYAGSLALDAAGDVLIGGQINSTSASFGTNTAGAVTAAGFVAKYTVGGDNKWVRVMDGGNSHVNAIAVGSLTNLYLAGGFESATLTLGSTTLTNRGSRDALVAVLPNPLIYFTTQPQGNNVVLGGSVEFLGIASGNQPISYQWRRNGTNITGATGPSLILTNVSLTDVGVYSVLASNLAGTIASSNAVLGVSLAFAIASQPQSLTSIPGSLAAFAVGVSGAAAPTYQWRKDGTNLTGATNLSLVISNLTAGDVGSYSVVVVNGTNSLTSSNAVLTIQSPPLITSQPGSQTVVEQAATQLSVTASGASPLVYQWRKNGTNIVGATSPTITFNSLALADAGTYSVLVTNVAGSTVSSNAVLTVIPLAGLPLVTTQPQSRTVREGASVVFKVTGANVTGYQWRRNGVALSNGARIAGATTDTLILSRVTSGDAGTYTVFGSNPLGNAVSSNAILTVSGSATIAEVGGWPDFVRGEAFGIDVVSNWVFVANGSAGLSILQYSNATLTRIAGVPTGGFAYSVAVENNTAYLADGDAGLQIIDVSDPWHPVWRGNYNTTGSAREVDVIGARAYIADYGSGLQIIDVSNPASPVRLGGYDTPGLAEGVVVSGNHAYVADDGAGLQIINITSAANPSLAATFDTSGSARGVAVTATHAFVADWTGGLKVISIADPSAPASAGALNTGGLPYDIEILGALAYVADFNGGLRLIDISNPSTPALSGTYDTGGLALDVGVSGMNAFVADWNGGVQVVNVTTPAAPTLITGLSSAGAAWAVQIEGSHAYVADFDAGLQVLNISDPATLMKVGSYDTSGTAQGLFVTNQIAYVADGLSGLQIISVTNPAAPVRLGSIDSPGNARGVHVVGNWAYVADETAGLRIYNISNPASPTFAGAYDTAGFAHAVQVVGNHAYVADFHKGLQIIDVSNPANPTLAGTLDTSGEAWSVKINGNHAYVADGKSGLAVINIASPSAPRLVGTFDTPNDAVGVSVSGRYAAVADFSGGLHLIDVNNPTGPVTAGSFAQGLLAFGVQVTADYVYVAARSQGLRVINLPGGGGFAPLISTQPQAVNASAGGTVTLIVSAVGTRPLSYQWSKGTNAIAGATNAGYTITNAQTGDSGSYTVRVGNAFGQVQSEAVVVSVTLIVNDTGSTGAAPLRFVLASSRIEDGVMKLGFLPASGQGGGLIPQSVARYRVEASGNLVDWEPLTNQIINRNGLLTAEDPDASQHQRRFYRVIKE